MKDVISETDVNEAARAAFSLASFHVSMFQIEKKSVEAAEVAEDHFKASAGAIKAHKQILLGSSAEWDAINAAVRKARFVFNVLTKPYGSQKLRLVANRTLMRLFKRMGKQKTMIEKKVAEFIKVYPKRVESAKAELKGLADDADYPSVEAVEAMFNVEIETMPLPLSSTYSEEVPEGMLKKLQKRTSENVNEAVYEALASSLSAVKTSLAKLALDCRKSAKPPGKGKRRYPLAETTFTRVIATGELLGEFNVFNDKKLAKASKLIAKLEKYAIEDIRKSDEMKEGLADLCDSILKKLNKIAKLEKAA